MKEFSETFFQTLFSSKIDESFIISLYTKHIDDTSIKMRKEFKALILVAIIMMAATSTFLVYGYAAPNESDFEKLVKDREFRIISRRGSAHELDKESDVANPERLESKLLLHARVLEVNERFVKFEILDGSIEIDGKTYDVDKGQGWEIVSKFGWIAINGECESSSKDYRFHLEGMFHIEAPRVVILGLSGIIRGDEATFHLRYLSTIKGSP